MVGTLQQCMQGCSFAHPLPTRTIVTGASTIIWGMHLRTLTVQGLLTELEASPQISVLEHREVNSACQAF